MCDSQHTEYLERYIPSKRDSFEQRVCFQASIYQELSNF